jgi:hypothetical protein
MLLLQGAAHCCRMATIFWLNKFEMALACEKKTRRPFPHKPLAKYVFEKSAEFSEQNCYK